MRRFRLLEPRTFPEAVGALEGDPAAKPIAGGTALLILIKHGVFIPDLLVNLRKISGASDVGLDHAGRLRIGALASIGDVERHPVVRERYPVLSEACHVVANVRIRNMATFGGNVAHADYQSDPPGALVALGAAVEVVGPAGTREVPLSDFLVGAYETALAPAELVTAVLLPAVDPAWSGAYLKFTTRSSEDRPTVGVTAIVHLAEGRIVDTRLVVGAATVVPARITEAEDMLRGQTPEPSLLARAGTIVEGAIDVNDDLRGSATYKRRIAGVLAERALARAIAGGEVR